MSAPQVTDEELKATQESLARMLADYLQSQGGPRLRACVPACAFVRLLGGLVLWALDRVSSSWLCRNRFVSSAIEPEYIAKHTHTHTHTRTHARTHAHIIALGGECAFVEAVLRSYFLPSCFLSPVPSFR